MCGIVGYTGSSAAAPILLEGLKRLEYRGYDSAGIAVQTEEKVEIRRKEGKVLNLEEDIRNKSVEGTSGIGHTRWATHGRPSEINAHPHQAGLITLVHNGIIENYLDLKKELEELGHNMSSETDTEIVAHLISETLKTTPEILDAVRKALSKVVGSYAIGITTRKEPQMLIAAKSGSPLVIGIGQDGNYIASDIPAILWQTREVKFLEDGDIACIDKNSITIYDYEGNKVERETKHIAWDPVMAEKGGYRHFMLKEIHEQPRALVDTIGPRIKEESGEVYLEDLKIGAEEFRKVRKIFIVACGTSWHAALVGKFMLESLTRIPVEVDIASEFRYRDPIISRDELIIGVTQSGETADTMAALKEARSKGAMSIAICNVVGSTISREVDGVIYTHAGPEIGVASTKAFTTQLAALYLLALSMAKALEKISEDKFKSHVSALKHLPTLIEDVLKTEEMIENISKDLSNHRDFLYLGRGINYPIALEGALKLKEISYIHAEGYPAGEMKHGPIALIDENMPVVVLAPHDEVYEKMLANMEEVKARDGRVIAIVPEGDTAVSGKADYVVFVPKADEFLNPFLFSIPLQFLAYYIAVHLGTDVDQPRNLAKSVTVE